MASKTVRCAIYTRKSTEHGLDLEFNSLDAQREACEAYIRSQAQEGWRALPQRYDDPAFSGGNLDRPALQELLNDIKSGRVDVVVVYKIDRLTRSLADFAKLIEIFDAKSISFVAITQQFNTTTSMGRLTLNVLLSFAQFERELASERVRDKVAASRKKGKWTGGSVPLGYDSRDRKLVINPSEANTVRLIFRRYLELKNLRTLVGDLNRHGIVSKTRFIEGKRKVGGIPFTYGPLAYLLKNRTFLGETGYGGAWFKGEHEPIIDLVTFNAVQDLLKSNAVTRRHMRFATGALLMGLLFDDRGNGMGPSYSTKKGVRYCFYVSSALLQGCKHAAGSRPRVSATDLEAAVVSALKARMPECQLSDRDLVATYIEKIILAQDGIRISVKQTLADASDREPLESSSSDYTASDIEVPWVPLPKRSLATIENTEPTSEPNPALVQAIARAHSWVKSLSDSTYRSVEALAASKRLNPKVVRKAIRVAFLAPDIIEAILTGNHPKSLTLTDLQKTLPFSWDGQRKALGFDYLAANSK